MKKIILTLLFILSQDAISQSFIVMDIDTTDYPIMRAKFYANDGYRRQIRNLSPSDFEITEDEFYRDVISVSCPKAKEPDAISSVLTIDVSGSMEMKGLEMAKKAGDAWINAMPLGKSECAITSFNEDNIMVQDFTTNRTRLLQKLNSLSADGGTDFNAGFIDPMSGALLAAEKGKYKKVVVFITDGGGKGREQAIIQKANEIEATVFCVVVDSDCPDILKNISEQTGGFWFENVTTYEQAKETYLNILQIFQDHSPCEIEWQSNQICRYNKIDLKISIPAMELSYSGYYYPSQKSIAKLKYTPNDILFLNKPVGVRADTSIKVTAINADFNVTNIISHNPEFEISPKSFFIKAGNSKELTVSFTPTDKNYKFAIFDIENDVCNSNFFSAGRFDGQAAQQNILKLTHPKGGEEFLIGSDTVITWEGILPSETISIEYSIDAGNNWNMITEKASGLRYPWTDIPKPPSNNCKVRIRNDNIYIKNIEETIDLSGHTFNVRWISWSPDGNMVATAGYDGTGRIWDADTGELIHTLSGHTDYVYHISWSSDGSKVATASKDQTARIWNAVNGNLIHILSGHSSNVCYISWSPDGSKVATASWDDTGRIWDANSGDMLHTLAEHNYDVYHISWSPDGNYVATASGDETGCIWDAGSGELIHTLPGHRGNVEHICWSPDGERVATASDDGKGRIWGAMSGEIIHTLSGHTGPAYHISWSPDGTKVATASSDNTGRIWDADKGELIHILNGHINRVYHISWNFDGTKVATASWDNTGKIWDVSNGELIYTLSGHTKEVFHISWSPDGTKVATAGFDYKAKIWELENANTFDQEDVSELFSIVAPLAEARSIDMGREIVGEVKDSLFTDFVENTGTYKVRIDSIYFTGADANAFAQVSAFPVYEIDVNKAQSTEFRFIPNRVGLHTAKLNIITQAETLEYDITGIGEERKLHFACNILDFGEVEITQEKTISDTVLIRNLTNQQINITGVNQLGPDMEQFHIISGGEPFTLAPNGDHKMTLQFMPKYGGRTSGQLGFEFNGAGSPAIVQLFGTGKGGLVYAADDSAYAGDQFNIKLMLGNVKPEGIAKLATDYEATIRFQRTLLAPSGSIDWQSTVDSIYITIKGKIGNSLEIAEIPVIACLGNTFGTAIDVVEMKLLDESGNPIEYEFEKQSGIFTLLGICREGGARLINPDIEAGIINIFPNPAEKSLNIEISLIEEGYTELTISNSIGESVQTLFSGNNDTTGANKFKADISNLANGVYYVILKTPNQHFIEKVLVIR